MQLKSDLEHVPRDYLGSTVDVVCCISFESRSLTVVRALGGLIGELMVVKNQPSVQHDNSFDDEIKKNFGSRATFVEAQIGRPVRTLDSFAKHILDWISKARGKVVVDITTFTHEHVLILLHLFRISRLQQKIVFAYTGAREYGRNPEDFTAELWLSKGVKEVRSVIGFPGALVPSKQLHLIMMVGFEWERAQTVVETYEPRRLSLGYSPKINSVSDLMSETNQIFLERIRRFVQTTRPTRIQVSQFEFPCIDPIGTRNSILSEVGDSRDYNVVICPLNTKLATVGAALAAFERDDIQICYAQAAIYNTRNYSTPGNSITWFDFE